MSHYGNQFFRAIVSLLEWLIKKILGPDRWRPAGAITVLPPSALIYDSEDEHRADGVFHILSLLGFEPKRVPVGGSAGSIPQICRTIVRGTEDCWATVVLEPLDDVSARNLGPAFRQYAHLHPDVVAVVVGPLPCRSEILERYRHVVTGDDGSVAAPELSAGIAHASAARVLHCARLLNAAVVVLLVVVLTAGIGLALVAWLKGGR